MGVLITFRRAATRGDGEAFASFVGPHLTRMSIVARRFGPAGEQDDIVQEALLRAWRSWHSFQTERGTVASWLCAIAANVARSRMRKARRAVVPLGANDVFDLEATMDLQAAISRLSERQRQAITCFYAADLTVGETATVMRCSEGTVKSTLSDARARLRDAMTPHQGNEKP